MKLQDFHIGMEFVAGGGFRWRCTDVGTRTISAIMLDPHKTPDWFEGPPYAVQEVVFDEDDMAGCGSNLDDLIGQRLATHGDPQYGHPGFDIDDMGVMFHPSSVHTAESQKVREWKGLMKRERVDESGVVWHPYHAARGLLDPRVVVHPQAVALSDMEARVSRLTDTRIVDGDWYILLFSPMLRTYSAVHPDIFLGWRIAEHTDYPKSANPFLTDMSRTDGEEDHDVVSDDNTAPESSVSSEVAEADGTNGEGSFWMEPIAEYAGMTADDFSRVLGNITKAYTDGKEFECFYYGSDTKNNLGLATLDSRHMSELKTIWNRRLDPDWRVATSFAGNIDTLPQWDGYAIRLEYQEPNAFMYAGLTSVVTAHSMYYDDPDRDMLFENEQAIGSGGMRGIVLILTSTKDENQNARTEGYLFSHRVAVDLEKREASRAVDPTTPNMRMAVANVIRRIISAYGYDVIQDDDRPMD